MRCWTWILPIFIGLKRRESVIVDVYVKTWKNCVVCVTITVLALRLSPSPILTLYTRFLMTNWPANMMIRNTAKAWLIHREFAITFACAWCYLLLHSAMRYFLKRKWDFSDLGLADPAVPRLRKKPTSWFLSRTHGEIMGRRHLTRSTSCSSFIIVLDTYHMTVDAKTDSSPGKSKYSMEEGNLLLQAFWLLSGAIPIHNCPRPQR